MIKKIITIEVINLELKYLNFSTFSILYFFKGDRVNLIKWIILLWNFESKKINEATIIIYGNIQIGKRTAVNKWKIITNMNAKTLVFL